MLDFSDLNPLPIVAALVAHMVIGAAYFGVLAKPWSALAHPGKTQAEIDAGPKWIYGIAAGGGLVTAVVLLGIFVAIGPVAPAEAFFTTFALWLGFVATKYATTYAFEYRPLKLWAIDTGYPLASMLAMAAIYVYWP